MAVQTPHRPPAAEPDPAVPAKRPKRRSPLWAKLCVTFGALLVVSSGTAIAGSRWLISSASESVHQEKLIDTEEQDQVTGKSLDGPINLLLLGVDVRPDWDINQTRADS